LKDDETNELVIAAGWTGDDPQERVSVMGVHFRPGGAFPFLRTSANELADAHVDLEALWGTSAIELRERLCEAKTPSERFDLLEDALVAHLFRPLERHYAVQFALDAFGRANSGLAIRDVARDAGLSQRRFTQLFAARSACHQSCFVVSAVSGKRSKQCDMPLCRIGRKWRWIVGTTTKRI
jgi:hypothetical protein